MSVLPAVNCKPSAAVLTPKVNLHKSTRVFVREFKRTDRHGKREAFVMEAEQKAQVRLNRISVHCGGEKRPKLQLRSDLVFSIIGMRKRRVKVDFHNASALSGMDDAGEMSSWYVFNAIGLYPYSPADPNYIVSVPLFQKTTFQMSGGKTLTILKKNSGNRISRITYDRRKVDGYFVGHSELETGKELVITTR